MAAGKNVLSVYNCPYDLSRLIVSTGLMVEALGSQVKNMNTKVELLVCTAC